MSTPIQPVPDAVLASEFPSLADRPAGTYNAKAKAWADSENAMALRTREIAQTAHDNAIAAYDAVSDASQSKDAAALSEQASADSAAASEISHQSAAAIAAAFGNEAGLPAIDGKEGNVLTVLHGSKAVGFLPPIPPEIPVVALDSDYTLTSANNTKLIEFSGDDDATLIFPPASELVNGWYCYVKNRSDADLIMQGEVIGSDVISDGSFDSVMGPDVVVNGDFSTGGQWATTGGWSISAGVASAVTAQKLVADVNPLVVGKWYKVTYAVVTRTAGTVSIGLGTTLGTSRTAAGTYSEILPCVGDGSLYIAGNGTFSGSVDNIIVEPYESWDIAANVIQNPRFENNGEGWELVSGARISFSYSTATFIGTGGILRRMGDTVNSRYYRVKFTISNWSSGTLSLSLNSGTPVVVSADGDYEYTIQAGSSATGFAFTSSSFKGTVSGVEARPMMIQYADMPIAYDAGSKQIQYNNAALGLWGGAEQAIPSLIPGKLYELEYTVKNWAAGGIAARFGAQTLAIRSSNGTFSERFVARYDSSRIQFAPQVSAFTGAIDEVQLRLISAGENIPDSDQTDAAWRMYPEEMRLFYCDGLLVRSVIMNAFRRTFTESGFFSRPPGYAMLEGMLWSAGNAGYRAADGARDGGGGGACLPFKITSNYLGASEAVLIGSGGMPGGSTNTGIGGDSSLGSAIRCFGSSDATQGASGFIKGRVNTGQSLDFAGGNVSNPDSAYGGGAGARKPASGGASTAGGSSLYGGGGGGGLDTATGTSLFAGNGGVYTQPGQAPAGGGGAGADATGGLPTYPPSPGARGELRIWGVI